MQIKNTPYFSELRIKIAEQGGLFNAHLHIDRSGTFHDTLQLIHNDESEASHLSLSKKHSIIPVIHQSHCYETKNLINRVSEYIEMMIDVGTTRADTVVDVTDDNVELAALEALSQVKDKYKSKIDFRLGAYSPLGFRDDQPRRWELIKKSAEIADFVGALPERDDKSMYPEHIGFEESCKRTLELSVNLKKPFHIHLDQQNHAYENATERFLEIAESLRIPVNHDEEPYVWLIHVISPSTYEEDRFQRMIQRIKALNMGVICCPSAAISMRQIRSIQSPTYNSIARVLDMLAIGIWVRTGSDNICDITSPAGTVDLVDELFVLCNAMRYYDLDVISKLGSGQKMSECDKKNLINHIKKDQAACDLIKQKYLKALF
jgi:cytosine/creatinine deaminase